MATQDVYIGYRKLKPGCIHLYCTKCGRKMSNVPRVKYDPPNAHIAQIHCDKCDHGDKDGGVDYRTKSGRYVTPDEIDRHLIKTQNKEFKWATKNSKKKSTSYAIT